MDLEKAKLESLRRSKEMKELQKFIYGNNEDDNERIISGVENTDTNNNTDSTID